MSLTFLVVDGDAAFRAACASLLRPLGHLVLEAASGAQASSVLEMCVPDLLLVDERLADVDGALWVERNRGACPGARFVLTSSTQREPSAPEALPGVALVLPKGLDRTELLERLGQVAGRRLASRGPARPRPAVAA